MSACHADRRSQLRKNIKRRHNGNRCCKSLQISAHTACFDLLSSDHDKYHNCPGCLSGQVCRRASQPDQTDQIGYNACGKQSRYKRNQMAEFFSHVSNHKFIRLLHDHFCQRLPLGNILHLQIMGQPDTKSCDQDHNDPAYDHCLADLNISQNGDFRRNGKIDLCSGYVQFHVRFHLPSFYF